METPSATTGVEGVVAGFKEAAPFIQDVMGLGSPSQRSLARWLESRLPELEVIISFIFIILFVLFILLLFFLSILLKVLLPNLSINFPCTNLRFLVWFWSVLVLVFGLVFVSGLVFWFGSYFIVFWFLCLVWYRCRLWFL